MADFFDPEVKEEVKPEVKEEKFTLQGHEYSQEELTKLVGLGEKAAQIEKNHGSFDKFVSEAGRRADEIGKYKQKVQELESQYKSALQPKQDMVQELTPEQVQQAKLQLQNLLGGEPITAQNFAQRYVAMREGEKLIEECEGLSSEIDGSDGRPKFDPQEIIQYMAETGVKKPLLAYKDKYNDQLKEWETQQLTEKAKPMTTMKASGDKEPKEVKPNRDNLQSMIAEALYGGQAE